MNGGTFIALSPGRRMAFACLTAVAYAAIAKVSFLVTIPPGNISPIFPAAGIALAAVYLLGRSALIGVWAGSFVSNLISYSKGNWAEAFTVHAIVPGAFIGLGAACGAWLGAVLVRKFCRNNSPLSGGLQVIYLLVFGALAGCLVSPTVGVSSLTVAGYIAPANSLFAWLTWWIGDSIGCIVMAPLILAWAEPPRKRLPSRIPFVAEVVALAAATAAVCYFAFFRRVPIDYISLVALGWAAFRFGMRGVSLVALVVACSAAVGTSLGVSTMATAGAVPPLLLLYSYLGTIIIFAFILAGLVEERRRQAEGLLESEYRFRIAVDSANIGVWDWDVVNDQLYWEESMFKLYGIRREDFGSAYDAWLHCVHPDDVARADTGIHDTLAGKRGWDEEFRIRLPSGEVRHILSGAKTFHDARGRAVRMVGANIDITDRKRAEEKLRESEARYRRLIDTANEGICLMDREKILFVNAKMAGMLGYAIEDFVGKSPIEFMFAEDAPHFLEHKAVREAGKAEVYERRFRHKDGREVWTLASAAPLFDESGIVTGSFAMFSDITARKRAELRDRNIRIILEQVASDRPLSEVLDFVCRAVQKDLPGALASVLLFDPNDVRLHHGAAPDLPEFYRAAVDGIPIGRGVGSCGSAAADGKPVVVEDILTHPYWKDFREIATKAGLRACWSLPILASDDTVVATFAIYHDRPFSPGPEEMQAVQVFVESIRIAIESDRTRREIDKHRQHLEDLVRSRTLELMKAKDAAEAANRAKSVFLANMSHELRTPLNAILGYAQMMLRERAPDDPEADTLRIVNKSGEHLLGLINSVLDLSKIETHKYELEPEDFDLGEFVREIADIFHRRAEDKGITLTVDQTSSFPRFVRTDRNKLRQVLINIVGNAVKFTDTGGVTLRLATGGPLRDDHTGELIFTVSDTGPGIRPEDVERIFKPFEQAANRSRGEGTGLGLTLARELVRLLGGNVRVEAAPGRGAVFTFDIRYSPVQPAEVEKLGAQPRGEIVTMEGASSLRVLIVEDQAENRILLHKLLDRFGFVIAEAENGEVAVRLAAEWKPDMIFMDRRMPVMDGVTATQRIRDLPEGDSIRIAAVTAEAFREDYEGMMAAGCDAFIRKPYRIDEILECIGALPSVKIVRAATSATPTVSATESTAVARTAFAKLPPDRISAIRAACEAADTEQVAALLAMDPDSASAAVPFLKEFRTDVIASLLPGA